LGGRKILNKQKTISTWQQFGKLVRSEGCKLLQELHKFPDAILVTGCQRSGTTILARIIIQSEGIVNHWVSEDDELDAALILSGYVDHKPNGRYCFQTTYLNECYLEYSKQIKNQKIIFLLRNPQSVVYSMLYNWRSFAFNELFRAVGESSLTEKEVLRFSRFGIYSIPGIKRACYAYNGKISQVFKLFKIFDNDQLLIVDYDDLAKDNEKGIDDIFRFLNLEYKNGNNLKIHSASINKADKLSDRKKDIIKTICDPLYLNAKKLITSR